MPPWGRPPGGYQGLRRRGGADVFEDSVYRFQELDSGDEGHAGILGPGTQRNRFVSDELFFNDVDPGYPGPSSGGQGDPAYGAYYGLSEEVDDHFEKQEEELAERARERIRSAKEAGMPTVSLTLEELEALEGRSVPRRESLAPRQIDRSKTLVDSSSNGGHFKKSVSRTPVFESPASRSKRGPGGTGAAVSAESSLPAPGFLVASSEGSSFYAPLGYSQRQRAPSSNSTHSHSRSGSRSASISGGDQTSVPSPAQAEIYDLPGAFPASPYSRHPSDPGIDRTPTARMSSSLGQSTSAAHGARNYPRSRSSSNALQHASIGSVHYQAHPDKCSYNSSSISQPSNQEVNAPYPFVKGRRFDSGPLDVVYTTVPRRVPVGGGRIPTSLSDPVLGLRESTVDHRGGRRREFDDDPGDAGLVDAPRRSPPKGSESRASVSGSGAKKGKQRRRK